MKAILKGQDERQQEQSMRARVEVVIRDAAGNIVSQLAPHEIDLKNQSLHDIEGAVEAWKRQALPEIEAGQTHLNSLLEYT